MVVAGVIQGVAVTVVGAVIGLWLAGTTGSLVGAAISLLAAVPYGRAVARSRCYFGTGRNVARCIVDATWSSLNSWAGAIYYGIHRIMGNRLDLSRSQGTGALWLERGVVSSYATTIGIVKAGSNDSIDRHESLHIFQARLFGPLYIPLVLLNYVVATIAPYWLLFYDKSRWPVTSFGTYFLNGVYPHVWNEAWAYKKDRVP